MLEIHPTPAVVETPATRERAGSGAFATVRDRRRYWAVVSGLAVLAVAFAFGVLAWDNPLPVGSPGFWRVAELRATSLVVIAIVVICQAMATVAFQSATNNRIITPSIMGFEALYVAVQTASVFFLGAAGVVALQGVPQFALQLTIMVVFAMLLYGWLLSGKYGNMQVMLLVGIILGGGLGSVSAFMQRLLTPSEFDVLTAKLFGSISNAEVAYLPLAVPLCLAAAERCGGGPDGSTWWRWAGTSRRTWDWTTAAKS